MSLKRFFSDINKLVEILGYEPTANLDVWIGECEDWYEDIVVPNDSSFVTFYSDNGQLIGDN